MLKLARPRLWLAGAVALGATIAVASLLPGPLVAAAGGFNDKLGHVSAYFLLALWLLGMVEPRRYLLAAVPPLLLGAALEVAQVLLTATRQADWLDLAANAAGIVLAVALAYLGLGGWAARAERLLGMTAR